MIELKHINKTYVTKKGVRVQALKNVSLKLEDKGMVFILGKSGSGKSTLLHILGALDSFDDGEFIIKGKSSKTFKTSDYDSYRNTLVGFVFQDYNILDEFTVGKNILLALELQGEKSAKENVMRALKEVELEEFYARKPNELSGGQKQRVAIARALVKNPEIIMADEPTGALDSKTGKQVFDTLKKLSQDKLVIVVSHDREFAEQYADRIIELADGEIISDVQKYQVKPDQLNAGVSVIDNKAILIKKGHKVTQSEIELITKLINSNTEESDTIIPLKSENVNITKKNLKINQEGVGAKFDATDLEKINVKKYGENDLKLKKSRMPFKDSFKMGASSLKHKKFRLILTIFLAFISFGMFGIVDTINSYNEAVSSYNAINDNNLGIYSIGMEEYVDEYYSSELNIRSEDIEKLKQAAPNHKFFTINYPKQNYYPGLSSLNLDIVGEYYRDDLSGITTVNENDLEYLNFDIIGRLPQDSETEIEVALTRRQYEVYKKSGIKISEGNNEVTYDINNENDLIGKNIIITFGGVKKIRIVGIIDTKLDSEKYNLLKLNPDFNSSTYHNQSQSFWPILRKSLHNAIYVSQNSKLYEDSNLYVVATKFIGNDEDRNIMNLIAKEGDISFTLQCEATSALNNFDNMYKVMGNIMLYVGLGMALFASLLFFNFITTSISYKKREIGILRAVGARSSDVFSIFFYEALIIALINWVLATIMTLVISIVINATIAAGGLAITVMNFGIRQVFLLLGVSVLVAAISTFLPVYKVSRKKPIDAIKDR